MRRNYVATVADLSDEALRCHSYGYQWELDAVSRMSPVGLEVWIVDFQCVRCLTMRYDQVEPGTYDLYRRRYSYPDGYRLTEPATTADKREEIIRRANPAE